MQLLHVLINLSDRSAREMQTWEVEKKMEMDAQIARMKIKELEIEIKHLQRSLGQVESNLTLSLKAKVPFAGLFTTKIAARSSSFTCWSASLDI